MAMAEASRALTESKRLAMDTQDTCSATVRRHQFTQDDYFTTGVDQELRW